MFRILIADDSNYMRESLRDILQEAGFEVIGEAKNGNNAVEIYKALVPDIVMLDISMPDGDGIAALKQIMELDRDAVVVMLTVVGKPEIVLEALNCGARSFLTKPFDRASVLQAIRQATAQPEAT
jgi:two-component system chemotaxis response regulator CheY